MAEGLNGLILATSPRRCVAKHRLFVWCDAANLSLTSATSSLIARDDDTTFGILHSRFHELWSLRLGTMAGERQRPPLHAHHHLSDLSRSPEALTPDIPAARLRRRSAGYRYR